jgi:uncharacterized protein (DUF1778 family)
MTRGRPPKAAGERKTKDIRIPVTQEQKDMVLEAMRIAGMDVAAWARPIILEAAQAIISEASKRTRKKNTSAQSQSSVN